MKFAEHIDLFFCRHPKLFLAAVLLLTVITATLLRIFVSTGSALVYQAF